MSISEDKIQEVRDATDIVDVVSQHVTLKKRGKTFVGLCPFHSEKTPSFHVDPVRGFYHCFGCGAGGNVFSFIMQMERIGFPEAVKQLAEKARIELPEWSRDDSRTKEIEELYRINQLAASFFREAFLRTEEGKQAQAYLYSKRIFNPAIAETFQIGWSPNSWDGLLKKALSVSLKPEALLKAGLAVPRKDGRGYYDRFRGRLMFPIHNPSGNVVGFGGRILQNDPQAPKYLNSPETAVYQKSRILYGLHQSKSGIQRENKILLVEGYLDLMRMVLCGFDYTVATSGTALTEGHAALLSRYAKNAVLIFDGDSAGLNAAIRGVDILVGAGLSVQVAPLPKGTDPDTFLLQNGKGSMEMRIQSAQHFVDFYIDQSRDKGKLDTISDKTILARSILSVISKISDPLVRNLMVKETSEKIGLDENVLFRELTPERSEVSDGSKPAVKNISARQEAEEGLLHLLLDEQFLWAQPVFQHIIPDHFRNKEIRFIVEIIHRSFVEGKPLNSRDLLDLCREDPVKVQLLTKLLSRDLGKGDPGSQFGLDCIVRLRQEENQDRIDRIRRDIQIRQNDGKDASDLIQEYLKQKKIFDQLRIDIIQDWKKHVENV